MNSRTARLSIALAMILGAAISPGVAFAVAPNYVFQNVQLPPLLQSHTFVLRGKHAPSGGCSYTYPDVTLPPDLEAWEVRDVGIDEAQCVKLVEEGVPTVTASTEGMASVSEELPAENTVQAAETPVPLTLWVAAAGYHKVWYENVLGVHQNEDKTSIWWNWSPDYCVSGSGARGDWW